MNGRPVRWRVWLPYVLIVGSALLVTFKAPPVLAEVSVPGVIGFVGSLLLALRLLWAIRKSGNLDRRP